MSAVALASLSPSPPRLLPLLVVIAVITVGCGGQGNVRKAAPPPDPIASANRLLAGGSYAAAAQAYLALANDADEHAARRYTALAALASRDAGDAEGAAAARALLPPLDDATDPVTQTVHLCALTDSDDTAAAATLAASIRVSPLTPYQRGHYARCAATAAGANGDEATAAARWVESWRYPLPADRREALSTATWRALAGLEQGVLAAAVDASDGSDRAWYELALTTQRAQFDPPQYAELTEAWQQRYPGHPATALIPGLLERAEALSVRPRRIALLLPLDDALADAARAIRDGFIAAWHDDSRNASRPTVKVYSSTSSPLPEVLAQIRADGCDFIVGPLRKEAVTALNTDSDNAINTLALNVTGTASRTGLYQYGLAPEDEAVQVARHALAQGRRALLVTADTPWGERLRDAYQRTWTELGGDIVGDVRYHNDTESYGSAVRRGLGVHLSELRHAELRKALSLPLHFEPRRREDVDVVLLAGFTSDAQQILPQLRYFRATGIPVFATSHVYGGGLTAARNVDLNGITFGDMPWLFGIVDRPLYDVVRRDWQRRADRYARLFGFGIDAYRLLPHVARMRMQPTLRLPGVTGDLWVDGSGIVRRNLTWLNVVDGIPTLVNYRSNRGAL